MDLKTEAEIDARPERIWDALVDFASYPDWNPFLLRVEGKVELGHQLVVRAGSSEGRQWTFKPRITALSPERELRWQAQFLLRGLFHGEQFFRLVTLESGMTRLVHGASFSGALVQYMGGFITDMARGFVGMNQALKRRAERVA